MRLARAVIAVLVVLLALCVPLLSALASPSESLHREGDEVFDDWEVCRTRSSGEDGFFQEEYSDGYWPPESFRPQIVFESLGDYADAAYRLGQEFAGRYPDRFQRAEEIFYFVRDQVRYQLDEDQFDLSEFAQNADELAGTIEDQGEGFGDCEDMAILLVVMLHGGGLRSAIVDCRAHAGVVVYLPGYKEANVVLEVEGESGWVWAEATGKNNPFGWFPEGQLDGPFLAYEISDDSIGLDRATKIVATPADLGFTFVLGGGQPAAQTLALRSSGQGTIPWSLAEDTAWLSAAPTSGTCGSEADSVTLSVDATGLAAGSYQAAVTISSAAASNSPVVVTVYLDVTATAGVAAAIALSSSDYTFKAGPGGSSPATQVLVIGNSGQGTLRWSLSEDAPWLTASPKSGASADDYASVALSVDPTGVAAGRHEATVTVSAPGASNSPQEVMVRLEVTTGSPRAVIWGVVFLGVSGLMLLIIVLGRRRRA